MKNTISFKFVFWTMITFVLSSILYGVNNFDGELIADIDHDGQ